MNVKQAVSSYTTWALCHQDDELKELKVAHNRRLERLRSVVTNYKLVKKQLRIVEEECYG